ncbi:MAG: 2-amino-4-hydroxy-6-hydroxymethyldihydropteridine diphosphokinase [Treponema sp.]|nr:2-amino-4-hydroxy-6-hydroxymethyldihydropteridine diphosphokinase [Treponema sp.]
MVPVALGLGSNKGFEGRPPVQLLGGAVFELKKILAGLEWSSVYKTRAMYYEDQDDFYNMAVLGFVDDNGRGGERDAFALLDAIHKIEARFGRDRSKEIRNGPRSLDIDIELYGSQKISAEDLTVPHPRLKERAFVLVPLVEILAKDADNIKWKGFGLETISELSRVCPTLCGQGIALELGSEAFLSYIKEERYGTRDIGTGACPDRDKSQEIFSRTV